VRRYDSRPAETSPAASAGSPAYRDAFTRQRSVSAGTLRTIGWEGTVPAVRSTEVECLSTQAVYHRKGERRLPRRERRGFRADICEAFGHGQPVRQHPHQGFGAIGRGPDIDAKDLRAA
jgi:hypothetical protein